MSLEIRVTPEGQSATQKLTSNLKKFFSILEDDELVMATKASFENTFNRDIYKSFVPGYFVYEVDDKENPTYFRELRWQADKDSTFPLQGAIGTDIYVIQLANQT